MEHLIRGGSRETEQVDILDIPVFSGGLQQAVSNVLTACLGDSGRKGNDVISATGAHGLVTAKSSAHFRQLLSGFYLNLPDGMPTVWIGRLKGARRMERCYGPDFFREVMVQSSNHPIKHFFCGGKDGVAEELMSVCRERFGNRNCVGCFSPPFREMSDDELQSLGSKISASGADIVWIGMSTPKQEFFASRLAKHVNVNFIITVGAAFDFHTGRLKQAPRTMQRMGLEWLFRLLVEPRRLYRRYFKIVPLFLLYGLLDVVTARMGRQKKETSNVSN